jgi:hypothetical protein
MFYVLNSGLKDNKYNIIIYKELPMLQIQALKRIDKENT